MTCNMSIICHRQVWLCGQTMYDGLTLHGAVIAVMVHEHEAFSGGKY